jgi:hypothetical protein
MSSLSSPGIAGLIVERYRVFRERIELELGALTLLAGENSAGKSSLMHPLLLLKQTMEAPLDPGPLLLDGENVRLTSADQMFTIGERGPMRFGLWTTEKQRLELTYSRDDRHGVRLDAMSWQGARGRETTITARGRRRGKAVGRVRFLLGSKLPRLGEVGIEYIPGRVSQAISRSIHVSGMRGTLGRTQPSAAVDNTFPGTFDRYVASTVEEWQRSRSKSKLREVDSDLQRLGITWKVAVARRSDVALELQVARTKVRIPGQPNDLVSLADVGLGTAQVLPVVVALHAAGAEQLVYIEQPELHLHPNAQVRLAEIIVKAVRRGVRVVIETHSSLLLLGVQTQIAKGHIAAADVRLHWFLRTPHTGETEIATADLHPDGTFGEWPVDFDEVLLRQQAEFMTALEQRRADEAVARTSRRWRG